MGAVFVSSQISLSGSSNIRTSDALYGIAPFLSRLELVYNSDAKTGVSAVAARGGRFAIDPTNVSYRIGLCIMGYCVYGFISTSRMNFATRSMFPHYILYL